MKILIVGGGGREHALAWRLKQSSRVTDIVVAPGNPGIATVARCEPVAADNIEGLLALAKLEHPHLVIVGPEVPLVMGLADKLRAMDVPVFGPSAKAAMLEGSKGFSKDFMAKHDIPTARYRRFNTGGPRSGSINTGGPRSGSISACPHPRRTFGFRFRADAVGAALAGRTAQGPPKPGQKRTMRPPSSLSFPVLDIGVDLAMERIWFVFIMT